VEPIAQLPDNIYRVPADGSFDIAAAPTDPPADAPSNKQLRKMLTEETRQISEWQHKLYADDRYALLLIFQAMDAAGKDSTIRHVLTGVNPAGCQVFFFRAPSDQELDHDFLWRHARVLPQRGRIGIFNRSYYEEVLVVRVHPEFLEKQRLPGGIIGPGIWRQRYRSIVEHERHLVQNGIVVLKFWLNVSKEEQRLRFLSRINKPHKRWKFSARDMDERALWNNYMSCYEDTLNATSKPWAPWYAIPADSKPFMRWQVAHIISQTMATLNIDFPRVSDARLGELKLLRQRLQRR
jgi:PPK2 family polyphosphate:nucleotide phosphotransferase